MVQKLQQTADKLIFVLVLLEVRQAAVAVTDAFSQQPLYILTELADGEQLRRQFLGDAGSLWCVAAEQGEDLASVRRQLVDSKQLRHVQRGAGDSGKQPISRLQDTDNVHNGNEQRSVDFTLAYLVSLNGSTNANYKSITKELKRKQKAHQFIQGAPVKSVSSFVFVGSFSLSLCFQVRTIVVM